LESEEDMNILFDNLVEFEEELRRHYDVGSSGEMPEPQLQLASDLELEDESASNEEPN
jgi:hypothetical protein